ncbi:unnamed protein product [Orchesella dallaii]|uniref:MTOR-associated protein MEAK7 n=1 Tax=Orchesella dallaii TaxID=48710 RepID=A0ABP1Q7I1_9HEXA
MGQQNTKREISVGQLNSEECQHLKKLFNKISTSNIKGEKGPYCYYGDLQKHCEIYLDDWLARRIADRLSIKSPKGDDLVVPLSTFLQFISSVVKGTLDDKIDTVWKLAIDDSPDKKNEILPEEILQYARSIIESYIKCMEKSSVSKSWIGVARLSSDSVSDFAEYLLSDILYSGVNCKEMVTTKPSKAMHTKEEILECFSKSHLLLSIHDSIFSHCFDVDKDTAFIQLIPKCTKGSQISNKESFTILDLARVVFLNSQLPSGQLRREWRLLFTTSQHGESFSKLLGTITDKGPTLLILKEHRNRVFGAFASYGWKLGPKFFGDEQSFLFHLDPKFAIYPATGYNQNFQYMNIQQQTLPNGLGMGGKFGYFGLWVDAEFGTGKGAPTCTTFSSPQLSTEEDFLIHHLEVWGLGPEPTKDESERDPRSILDQDPEAKMMLEMLNRGGHSDAYRDEPKD